MIKIKNVTIRNFLSVGQNTQAVDLCGTGLTLVLGKNADIGAANARNGVGKSSLIQAITYGLYGEPLTNIKVGNLINFMNQKSMLVTIDFERDGVAYRIERGRKPNLLKFFVNDKQASDDSDNDEAKGENKHTQEEIERVLGMSHLLFKHLVALNTFTEPFLKMKPAAQREVIEELLGITQISERDEALMKLIQATKVTIRDEETTIKAITEANARIGRAIDKAKEEHTAWDRAQTAKVEQLATDYESIDQIDFAAEIGIFDLIDAWVLADRELKTARTLAVAEYESLVAESKAFAAEIKKQSGASLVSFETQLTRLQAEISRCEAEAAKTPDAQIMRLQADAKRRETDAAAKIRFVDSKSEELAAILLEIENADGHTCSTCGQDLDGTDHLAKVIAVLQAKAKTVEAEITRHQTDAVSLQQDAEGVLLEIDTMRQGWAQKQDEWRVKAATVSEEYRLVKADQEAQKQALVSKIAEMEADMASLAIVVAERQAAVAEIDTKIVALGRKPVSAYSSREDVWKLREAKDKLLAEMEREAAKENPHAAHIKLLESTLTVLDYKKIEDAQGLLKHQEFLHKLLSGKDSFIRKKIIDQNLNYLNTRMNKYLEALALPHEVRFMPDLSVNISMLGRELDFEQLSRGEGNRVILATSWSFRDMWESVNTSLNLCICDENVDQGMDPAGADAVVEVLNSMARKGKNVFLISHNESLIGRCNRILMVHKANNFTTFEDNAEAL